MWWRGNRELRLFRLHVCFTCTVSVSVCVQPLSVLSASGWCNARPSEAYVTTKAAQFFLKNFFISRCHTRRVACARHPILSLLSGDAREANPSRPRFLSASILLTFFFSFFSSFLVKRVWTHQILVNMLPYARLKPRPRSHRRNCRRTERSKSGVEKEEWED